MNSLKFRRGYKDWDTTFEVKLNCEYTSDLDRRIRSLIIHKPDVDRKVRVQWDIFEQFLYNRTKTTFVDSDGLTIRVVDNGININDGRTFNLTIKGDQLEAIKLAAHNAVREINRPKIGFFSRLGVK